jgi:hypothetical protein
MACPTIAYGIPRTGATDLNFNSGRELFRCGIGETGCITMFITNVTLESSLVKIHCGTIADSRQGDVCLQSGNLNWKDQAVVNWEAKEGVTSDLPAGTVITRATPCGSGDLSIYTHTEGQLSAKVQANVCDITSQRAQIMQAVLDKNLDVAGDTVSNELDWVLSDISINASATDWQGGNVSYQGFGSRTGGSNQTYRFNFNWQTGKAESALGSVQYDESATPALMEVIVDQMLDASPDINC